MRAIYILMIILLAAVTTKAQMSDDAHAVTAASVNVSFAPVALYTGGPGGSVFTGSLSEPVQVIGGEMLPVGHRLAVLAVPAPGYKFENWQRVSVFFFSEYTVNSSGQLNPPTLSTVISPVPTYRKNPLLSYQVQPGAVLYEVPNVSTIVQINGWMANFVPIQHPAR